MAGINWKKMSINELARRASLMPPKEVSSALKALGADDQDNLEKISTLAEHLDNKKSLETLGQGVTPNLFLHLVNTLDFKKLSPIIVGMPHQQFRSSLLLGTEEQLQKLKTQSMSEPLQHQITLYTHEINSQLDRLLTCYEKLEFRIEGVRPEKLSPQERVGIWQEICTLSEKMQELMHECSIILLFAWNTDRSDLIDQLTIAKERAHRISRFGIGFPATGKEKASGMFKRFDEVLFSVYGVPKSQDNIEALSNDEAVTEGLAKFSIWYVKDYWDIGLLPNIRNEEELDLDETQYTEKERVAYRAQLLQQVQENLARLGLETVADLKRYWIYSKETLLHYLEEHKVEIK